MEPSSAMTNLAGSSRFGFDEDKCIICQTNDPNKLVTSEERGRTSLKRAAEIRDDVVTKRIKLLENSAEPGTCTFWYHNTSKCFKNYIHPHKLNKIINKKSVTSEPDQNEIPGDKVPTDAAKSTCTMQLRHDVAPCAPPSTPEDPYKLPCVICGQKKYKGKYEKFRICEEKSAAELISAARLNQDQVFTRLATRLTDDIQQSITSVIAGDFFCHKVCRRSYTRDDTKPLDDKEKVNIKTTLFFRTVPYLNRMLDKGEYCTVKDIVEFSASLLKEGEHLDNEIRTRDIKDMLITYYGDTVCILPNTRQNESDIIFSSSVDKDELAIKIKNQDILKEAGAKLREVLQNVDFGLEDSFGDSAELKDSWERTVMPAELTAFLASLFNIPVHKLFTSSVNDLQNLLEDVADEDTNDDSVGEEETRRRQELPHHKNTQLQCLFQMLVYNLSNGRKKTPLHLMLGHALFAKDRSKNLITAFNRIGACVSYDTVRSARSLLANYAIMSSEDGETPLPSTFTRNDFTMGGMDNSDYSDRSSLSGTEGLHYAAMVLFQDSTEKNPPRKPCVSNTTVERSKAMSRSKLPCQEVRPHFKPKCRPSLPSDMLLHPETTTVTLLTPDTARNEAAKREFVISVIRTGASTTEPHIWSAVHTLVSSTAVPLMRVGFLPVIPRPITERSTVRHCLTNFQSVRKQLNQSSMAVWCDEGVFAPAMDIVLHEEEKFRDLFICMGPFHWTRVLLRCQGRLLRGCGIDDALVECGVFGPGVRESVLNGSHYVRALTGMLIVEDIIRRLQWQMFWNIFDPDTYPVLSQVSEIQNVLAECKRCPEQFQALTTSIGDLHDDFKTFEKECEEKSEVCRFLGQWLRLVAVIKNAVVSDREGNWDLHVATVEDSMPIFQEFDSMNYLRHGSWYLERIKVLEKTHPELYRRFSLGQWAVQTREGWFCAVGCDMKVEQTIQRVSKGPGGHFVVGATRNAAAVAEFELLFHEIGNITSLLDLLTSHHAMEHTECHLQYPLSRSRRHIFNRNVEKLYEFIQGHQNPYSKAMNVSVPVPLHNIISQDAVDEMVKIRILNCIENGKAAYRTYRDDVFVKKTRQMSAVIKKQKLPAFTDELVKATPDKAFTETPAVSPKCIATAQRHMDMARERGTELSELLSHDLFTTSTLFDGDLPGHATKSQLLTELEGNIVDPIDWSPDSDLETHIIVDFMSKVRQMPIGQCATLGSVIDAVTTSAASVSNTASHMHLVFDSYLEMSLKEGERLRRAGTSGSGIEIIGMSRDTSVPRQLDKFWASDANKQNIQFLARDTVRDNMHSSTTGTVIASSIVYNGEVIPAITAGGQEFPDLLSWIEEADARLILHVSWAITSKLCKRAVVISNDTDTMALLLHYTPYFKEIGLQEIWQQVGTGEKRRMIPLHIIASKLGAPLARTVIKAHILSGDDCMSKVGSKHAAMSSDPVRFLSTFGESHALSEQDAALAERYLVRVFTGVRSSTCCETFDQLRLEAYSSGRRGIDALPPTSSVMRLHITRAAYLVNKACNLLNNEDTQRETSDDAKHHGWEDSSGMLLPTKGLKPLPCALLSVCKCAGRCDTRRCQCRSAGVYCTIFCHGKTVQPCANSSSR